MHSTSYIIKFVLIMTTVVALILSLMFTGLKDIHMKNEAIYNKQAILSAIQNDLDKPLVEMTQEDIQAVFDESIEQKVYNMNGEELSQEEVEALGYTGGRAEDVNMEQEMKKPEEERVLPLYIYKSGDKERYIASVRGKGLWDAIWGNIAFQDDLNTIAGVNFDHKSETPGLGAEIKDNAAWKDQFIGKKIFDNGEFVSIDVVKGGVVVPSEHKVDGISGATITADGVEDMLEDGLEDYLPVFEKMN